MPGLWFVKRTIQLGLRRVRLAVFPAQWQANECIGYGIGPEKVRVIPFGANFPDPGDSPLKERLQLSDLENPRMLFVGKDWLGKGGDLAVETLVELRRRGYGASLDVVGPNERPPQSTGGLTWHGALSKLNPNEAEKLDNLYRSCHLLIVPSIFEGFGIVYAEAASYGMPSLAFDAYGLRGAVNQCKSGVLLPPASSPSAFADVIVRWIHDFGDYGRLCIGAREYYESDVNWGVAARRLVSAMVSIGA